jgi:hypothetical protein
LEINYLPDYLPLLSSGLASSTIEVKASKDLKPGTVYAIDIQERISLSSETLYGKDLFVNAQPTDINKVVPLSITIPSPLTSEELLKNFTNWVSSINIIWTLVAGIIALMGPLIYHKYTKKDQKSIPYGFDSINKSDKQDSIVRKKNPISKSY